MKKTFFALVGPKGAGKSTLLKDLKGTLPDDQCVFLRDSNGCGDESAPHTQFTRSFSLITRNGLHRGATARSQLLLFWSRLECIIENDVRPNLENGKYAIMDGFGGTILAHAMQSAKSEGERDALLEMHKSMIQHCVVGLNVPPPTYLWLRPSPEVAYNRLRNLKELPDTSDPYKSIEELNGWFDFYGQLPGQTVVSIDANRPHRTVLEEALRIIGHPHAMKVA